MSGVLKGPIKGHLRNVKVNCNYKMPISPPIIRETWVSTVWFNPWIYRCQKLRATWWLKGTLYTLIKTVSYYSDSEQQNSPPFPSPPSPVLSVWVYVFKHHCSSNGFCCYDSLSAEEENWIFIRKGNVLRFISNLFYF